MKSALLPLSLLAAGLAAPAAFAAGLDLNIEVPQIQVAEYHRPYVAVWIEKPDASLAANLNVWYQLEKRGGGPGGAEDHDGTKWLKDLRQWWRRGGRTLQMPVDGVSGATRPEGKHDLHYAGDAAPLKDLAPGTYRLVVEAARETGGREMLKIEFVWPPTAEQHLTAQGKTELGAIALDLRP